MIHAKPAPIEKGKRVSNLDDLKPGPDLDALVAEKVMKKVPCDGWVSINLGSAGGPALTTRRRLKDGSLFPKWGDGECTHADNCYSRTALGEYGPHQLGGPPKYSTSIANAWEVREEVKKWCFSRRRCFMLALQDELSKALNEYDAGVRIAWEGIFLLVTPHAICLAALKAVGYTDE